MTRIEEMAAFVDRAGFEDLSGPALEALKIRILDSLGCAFGALGAEPMQVIRAHLRNCSRRRLCALIGGGGSSPDLAAFHNGALVRYLDFNDSYLAPGETCHPSDNFGAVLAACEFSGAGGKDLLAALAVAYQVQCRLSDEAPVRDRGFDHVTQGAYSAAAGAAKALGLDRERIAHAIAISGTAFNALRVTRTGRLSHWKGLAFPNAAFGAVHAALLAGRGITGPLEAIEGRKGFMESIAGDFEIDWGREDLERVTRTILKKHNAEIHSQSAIDAILRLRESHGIDSAAIRSIKSIEIETFDVARDIIGGGGEGDKTEVRTKEQADHSLPYLAAAALLDGAVLPAQYAPRRIAAPDVQELLHKVRVRAREEFSRRFPAEMPARVAIRFGGGRTVEEEVRDYDGFTTRPMSWERALAKFREASAPTSSAGQQDELAAAIRALESEPLARFTALLEKSSSEASREE